MSMPKGTNRTLKESQRTLVTFSMTIVSPYRRKLPLGYLYMYVSTGTISTLIEPPRNNSRVGIESTSISNY